MTVHVIIVVKKDICNLLKNYRFLVLEIAETTRKGVHQTQGYFIFDNNTLLLKISDKKKKKHKSHKKQKSSSSESKKKSSRSRSRSKDSKKSNESNKSESNSS